MTNPIENFEKKNFYESLNEKEYIQSFIGDGNPYPERIEKELCFMCLKNKKLKLFDSFFHSNRCVTCLMEMIDHEIERYESDLFDISFIASNHKNYSFHFIDRMIHLASLKAKQEVLLEILIHINETLNEK